jgi:hypothetical protein
LDAKTGRILQVPRLTTTRIVTSLIVAVVADGLQLALGPFGWVFGDQIIDVVAMVLTTWLLGFHVLLLPTFVVELLPIADMLPTWTGCVIAVIALRKRAQRLASQVPINVPASDSTDLKNLPPVGR